MGYRRVLRGRGSLSVKQWLILSKAGFWGMVLSTFFLLVLKADPDSEPSMAASAIAMVLSGCAAVGCYVAAGVHRRGS